MGASIDASPAADAPTAGDARTRSVAVRILTGAGAIPLLLAVAWAGGWVFAGAIGLLAGVGAWEYARLAERRGHVQPRVWMVAAAAAFWCSATAWVQGPSR